LADGHVLIEVNNERKARLKENVWYDIRLMSENLEDSEGCEQLLDQIKEDVSNTLLLVVFDFHCHCTRDYWGEYDCEYIYNVASYTVVKNDYKEFYREQVSLELDMIENGNIEFREGCYYSGLISEWEEFYDEEFVKSETGNKKSIL